MPNIFEPDFDEAFEKKGFRAKRARIGYQLGTSRIGLSLFQVPPGQAAYPYHFHLAEEEALIVLSGRPRLRTDGGWRTLVEGEVVAFPVGGTGAHQLMNPGPDSVRFLAVSTNGQPEILVFPDSGRIGVGERLPRGGGLRHFFRQEDAIEHLEGEHPPETDHE